MFLAGEIWKLCHLLHGFLETMPQIEWDRGLCKLEIIHDLLGTKDNIILLATGNKRGYIEDLETQGALATNSKSRKLI